MNRWIARFALRAFKRMQPDIMHAKGERFTLESFRRAYANSAAYRALLNEAKVDPGRVRTIQDFTALVPILDKTKTFGRFPLQDLCALPIGPRNIHNVITSSGQGGRFAFGILSRKQMKTTVSMIDLALDLNFQVFSQPTFLINCLPMGVGFQSNAVTIAETSVREDMVVALMRAFSPHYEQLIVVCDPLFLKRLIDYAHAEGLDWRARRTHFVIGEETFSESLRNYIGHFTGIDPDDTRHGLIGSTYGIGELAMNLFFESRRSIALRRLAYRNPDVFRQLFGDALPPGATPMIFVYNPMRTFIEIVPDMADNPIGRLVVTLNDPAHSVPLPRYDTGDRARIIDPQLVQQLLDQGHALPADEVDLPFLAILGRDKDHLPGGYHIGQFKEMVCQNFRLAQALSGAFTLSQGSTGLHLHLQLNVDCAGLDTAEFQQLQELLPPGFSVLNVTVHPYREFPTAMTLDYERKLNYFI